MHTKLNQNEINDFQAMILARGEELYRDMPWRSNTEAYWILVSEIMLQQTQVDRVIPKFQEFVQAFPTLTALAQAPQSAVLSAWLGLGYNRRARFLHQAAIKIEANYGENVPDKIESLVKLPGIGPNTAAAICVYAFNQPHAFIETNVRSVYIDYFFDTQTEVTDKEILAYVTQTLPTDNPREWFWAIMDLGSTLKKSGLNPNRASKHYTKQSQFSGSNREIRGKVLRLLQAGPVRYEAVLEAIGDERTDAIIKQLINDGLVGKVLDKLSLAD